VGVGARLVGEVMSDSYILLGLLLNAASGVLGLLFPRNSFTGQRVTTLVSMMGCAIGLLGVIHFWLTRVGGALSATWTVAGAPFRVGIDDLSAWFLVPIFLISLLGQLYGLGYWRQSEHPTTGRKWRFYYGLLTAGMGLLVMAQNAILFLFGWELMALAAYFLVTTEDEKKEVRDTGWIYLVATHLATLSLFALFALLRRGNGNIDLSDLSANALSGGEMTTLFVLMLVGFGIKAGIMPLHVWLPSSHAIAPSHVSAIMSGVIIKMGIYGLLRITSLLPNLPVSWGVTILVLGIISGVLGVAYALGQHDLKRLLAYHSIENIGIIVIGLGLAMLGRSLARPEWVVLGLAGCLLHVWNHALFKALLFFGAGSVLHAAHTREIDNLGGLAKSMRWTALGFLVGAVAICGLPPLNGFVSEFLIYLGLFKTLFSHDKLAFAFAALGVLALALIGALALACFVKVYGVVFLGTARSEAARKARESPASMLVPMGVLAGCCLFIGLAPTLVAPILGRVVETWAPRLDYSGASIPALAPLSWITGMGLAILAGVAVVTVGTWAGIRSRSIDREVTWGCGYALPTSRMQYTSSSFAAMVIGLFRWVLRPRSHLPNARGVFPGVSTFHSHVPDAVLDEAVLPTFSVGVWILSGFRFIQRGSIQAYLLYVFVALIALLVWSLV
jgi:hydrogenase-4 component B